MEENQTYQVCVTYEDEKAVNFFVGKNEVETLFECLTEGKRYFNVSTNTGFWTPLQNVRHIIVQQPREVVEKIEEKNDEPKEQQLDQASG